MKTIFCILLAGFIYTDCSAQQLLVNGYIILPGEDTLAGKIKFGGFRAATNTDEVTFEKDDSVKRYKAKKGEIIGYGFESAGFSKHFRYFELKQKPDSRFFEWIYTGKAYTLYGSSVTGSFGTVDVSSIWYVLQKPDGQYVQLETCGLCAWRKNLAEFLADNPEALAGLEAVKPKELGKFLRSISK
jgi:hypothetical protein